MNIFWHLKIPFPAQNVTQIKRIINKHKGVHIYRPKTLYANENVFFF